MLYTIQPTSVTWFLKYNPSQLHDLSNAIDYNHSQSHNFSNLSHMISSMLMSTIALSHMISPLSVTWFLQSQSHDFSNLSHMISPMLMSTTAFSHMISPLSVTWSLQCYWLQPPSVTWDDFSHTTNLSQSFYYPLNSNQLILHIFTIQKYIYIYCLPPLPIWIHGKLLKHYTHI